MYVMPYVIVHVYNICCIQLYMYKDIIHVVSLKYVYVQRVAL